MDHEGCRSLLGSLSDYVDGVLETELCAEIERHMQGCENCRVVVDSLRKTISLYHAAASGPAEVPTDVRDRLMRRLELDDFIRRDETQYNQTSPEDVKPSCNNE